MSFTQQGPVPLCGCSLRVTNASLMQSSGLAAGTGAGIAADSHAQPHAVRGKWRRTPQLPLQGNRRLASNQEPSCACPGGACTCAPWTTAVAGLPVYINHRTSIQAQGIAATRWEHLRTDSGSTTLISREASPNSGFFRATLIHQAHGQQC